MPTLRITGISPVHIIGVGLGQSNEIGVASKSGLPTSPVNLQLAQDDIIWSSTKNGTVVTRQSLQPAANNAHGPEITRGRAIADAFPFRRTGVIQYAQGGTSLQGDWLAGANYLTTAIAYVASELAAWGSRAEVGWVFWTHGEADAIAGTSLANNYAANMATMMATIRACSWGRSDMPIIYNQLNADTINYTGPPAMDPDGLAAVRAGQASFDSSDANAYMFSSDSQTLNADHLHYPSPGAQYLGTTGANLAIAIGEP